MFGEFSGTGNIYGHGVFASILVLEVQPGEMSVGIVFFSTPNCEGVAHGSVLLTPATALLLGNALLKAGEKLYQDEEFPREI